MKYISDVFKKKWSSYRYRFVPWLAWNLGHSTRRTVEAKNDKINADNLVIEQLIGFLRALHEPVPTTSSPMEQSKLAHEVMITKLGFATQLKPSIVSNAGLGIFITEGKVFAGSLVALYPGTIYRLGEPLLLPSICNPFVFRCIDGIHIDGKRSGLSKYIYKSCVYRDLRWPFFPADLSWLTGSLVNPLNCGQFINNESRDFPCNVAYQELDLVLNDVPFELRRYLPNVYYSHGDFNQCQHLRIVAIVANKDIAAESELFSTYYTIVHK